MSSIVATQIKPLSNAWRLQVSVRRVVILVVAMSTALSWMSSVSASCGNYLYRNGKQVSQHSMTMDELNGASADIGTTNETPIQIPVRRCSGPNCSSSPLPLAPIPAVPSNLINGFDQAAVLESLAQSQNTRGAIEIPESERGACFEPSSIFRPPAV